MNRRLITAQTSETKLIERFQSPATLVSLRGAIILGRQEPIELVEIRTGRVT